MEGGHAMIRSAEARAPRRRAASSRAGRQRGIADEGRVVYRVPPSSSGDSWATDQRLMARGTWTGGTAARSWVALDFEDGATDVVSTSHGGSFADPRSYGLTANDHAYATLGSGHQTGLQHAQAHAAAWQSLGRSATAGSTTIGGLVYGVVRVSGAVRGTLQTGSARAFAATGSGRVGTQRIYFGTDAEQSSIAHGGEWIWARIVTGAGGLGVGRITSIGCHGTGGYLPRLAVAKGGSFAAPGTFTEIRYGDLTTPLSNHNAGRVAIEALAWNPATEPLWVGVWSDGTGALSRRAHGATPTGQFAWTLNEAYRTVTAAADVVEDGSETFSFTGTGNFYTSLFVTFEDAANGYQGNGVFASGWYGAVRDATTDSPSSLTPSNANDSFRHTMLPIQYARSSRYRISFNTISASNGVLAWMYSFSDWAWPMASTPRALLGRRGAYVPTAAGAYNEATWDADIPIGAEQFVSGEVGFLFGNAQGATGGGVPTGTAIYFDAPTGGSAEGVYLNHWPDTFNIDRWSDAILDPDNLAGTNRASRSQYYQSQAGNMPMNDDDASLPATFDVSGGAPADSTFGSILRMAISVLPQYGGYEEL